MKFQNCISKSAFINSKIFQKGTVQQIDINQSRCGPSIHRPSSTTWAIFCSFPIKMPRWINYSKHLPLILSFGCQLLHVYKIQSNNFISFHFVSYHLAAVFFLFCVVFWPSVSVSVSGSCVQRVSLAQQVAVFCGLMIPCFSGGFPFWPAPLSSAALCQVLGT